MSLEFQLFLEIGIIIFLAFLGVILTNRFGQSVLLAYILIGVVIGPFGLGIIGWYKSIDESIFPLTQEKVPGVIIYFFAEIGLVLLLFFVGLEFSLSKLKRTQKPAVILATFDVGINVFAGIVLGTFFGWPIVDTIILACIIAMSSVAVTIKILEDLKRQGKAETEILVSLMIVEDFASIILLTAVGSFVMGSGSSSWAAVEVFGGIIVLFVFFIIFSLVFLPTIIPWIMRSMKKSKEKNSEWFALFALAIVLLPAAFAEFFGITAMVGAFLMGMGFAESKLADELKDKLSSFKSVFVAIFFISFGMLINPSVFPQVGTLIMIAVPLTIFNELLLLALVALLIGMTAEAAISVGAGALGRSEEAIIFANVGTSLKTPANQSVLSDKASSALAPFAGGFCLIMSSVTPIFMRASYGIADLFRRRMPTFLRFSAMLISRMIRGMIFSSSNLTKEKSSGLAWLLMTYLIIILTFIAVMGIVPGGMLLGLQAQYIVIILFLLILCSVVSGIWHTLSIRLNGVARSMELPGLPMNRTGRLEAVNYTGGLITGSLFTFVAMAVVWMVDYRLSLIVLALYAILCVLFSKRIYLRLVGELQWIARDDLRKSSLLKPVVLRERPATFTHRGRSWEHRNPRHIKKK